MTLEFIHDCDPGNDDALAILAALGSDKLDLRAVTTGAGHLAHHRTARNAAIALAAAGAKQMPLTRGADGPLVRERLVAQALDMERGLDRERPELPAIEIDASTSSADLIARIAAKAPGLTVATTGPLTNLALAFRTRPEVISRLERVVVLGGAWGLGNKTAAAEWNILCDPEAASIVLSAGAPVTLVPIDAAAQVTIDEELIAIVAGQGGAVAPFAAELLTSLRSTHRQGALGPREAPLNDPLAVLVAANPKLARTIPARVDVELAGRHTYGRTVIDFANRSNLPLNCEVVVAFDVGATRLAFVDALGRLS